MEDREQRDLLFRAAHSYTQCLNPTMTAERQREFVLANLNGSIIYILSDPGSLYRFLPNLMARLKKLNTYGIEGYSPIDINDNREAFEEMQGEADFEQIAQDIKEYYETTLPDGFGLGVE